LCRTAEIKNINLFALSCVILFSFSVTCKKKQDFSDIDDCLENKREDLFRTDVTVTYAHSKLTVVKILGLGHFLCFMLHIRYLCKG